MLILDRASENKLEELVLVSRKLNGVLREIYPRVHKIEPDRAALLWCAIDDEIEKRQKQIDKILATESGAEQIVLSRACSELKKEYDQYNQLMEEIYDEELLPATIPELLISSVQRATLEMQEINKNLQHTKEAMNILTITNNAYISKSEDDIGREIPLSSIDEWKNLPATISYAGLEKPDFGYYRNPIKNEIDRSPCGVSIFESGIDQLESVDTQNARLKWEFESGERAINVSTTALQPIVGEEGRLETPKLDKRLYRGLNLDAGDDGDLYKEWSPEFRDISIINGLNQFLRQLEFNVSLSYGDLSDVTDVDKTATEVKIAKKRKYNMVSAIQENLKDCLEDLVYALAFYNAKLHSGYEFNCTFKDSILVDDETERQNDRADVSLGAMQLWEYRMKHYAEDEETAKKMVVQQADVIED